MPVYYQASDYKKSYALQSGSFVNHTGSTTSVNLEVPRSTFWIRDPIPLVDSFNVLESKCSVLEMKILRKIQNLDIKTFIYKCIFLQFYHFWLSYEIEYEPKQRSVSKECIGNSSLSPDETLHSIGLNGWFSMVLEKVEACMFIISNSMKTHVT